MSGTKLRKGLSARELDVARLLMRGASNKEIARALGVEVVTVKRHVGNILRKLGARNRTQAAIALAEFGGYSSVRSRPKAEVILDLMNDEAVDAGHSDRSVLHRTPE